MFNPVAPYRYLLHSCICLWHISQIQTGLCVVVGPDFVSPKNGKSGSHYWGREVSTQRAQQLAKTAVTVQLLVGCVVWKKVYRFCVDEVAVEVANYNMRHVSAS